MFYKLKDLRKQSLGELQYSAKVLEISEKTVRHYINTFGKKQRINSKNPWISLVYQYQSKGKVLALLNLGSIIICDDTKFSASPPTPDDINNAFANNQLLDAFAIEDAIPSVSFANALDLLPDFIGDVVIICCDFDTREGNDAMYFHRRHVITNTHKLHLMELCKELITSKKLMLSEDKSCPEIAPEIFPDEKIDQAIIVSTKQVVNLIAPRLYNPETQLTY